jgi:uncharacterized membrane protein (UPF0182 family)
MPDRGGGPTGPRIRAGRPSRRVRTLLTTLGVLAVLGMAFTMFAGFWTDWLWYRSVKYSSVFTTTLATKIGLFFVFGLLMALAVGFNIWLAHRLRPPLSAMSLEQQNLDRYRMGIAPYKKWLLLGITAVVGLIAGASAAGQWRTWLQWVNGVPFHQKDPQFHLDVSFYAFDLPWYRFLLGFGFAAAILSVIAAALTHYLYGGLRITSPGARATAAATGHLSVLIGVFVALKAVAYWLDRYGLAVKSSDFRATDNWTGLRFTDANAYLPAKTILFCIAVICALLFFATLWRRTWQLPVIGFGLMVLSAILIGGLYPAIVQKFQVQPNEQAKEAPYVAKNIKATREAYGIDDTEVSEYPGESTSKNRARLRDDADSTASIRLMDPNIISPTFQQLQQVRNYYGFPSNLAVDRYRTKDGKTQDTVIGLRSSTSTASRSRTGSTTTSATRTATAWSPPRARRPTRRDARSSPSTTCPPRATSAATSSGSTTARRPRSTRSSAARRRRSTTPTTRGRRPPATGAGAASTSPIRSTGRRTRWRSGNRRSCTRAPSARVRGSCTTAPPRSASRRSRRG